MNEHSGAPDPSGDDLYKLVKEISLLSSNLLRFVYERSELYGLVMNFMLDKGLYECEVPFADIQSLTNYTLSIDIDADKQSLKLKIKAPEEFPTQD